MRNTISIRPFLREDIESAKAIIDENALFPSALLNAMLQPFFEDRNSQEYWFVACHDQPVAIAYCVQEKMTEGTWNLLLIAVKPSMQGTGIGTQLIAYVEAFLQKNHERILLVETSALSDYAPARAFYRQRGYTETARIPEYYTKGEDKVVFWKHL